MEFVLLKRSEFGCVFFLGGGGGIQIRISESKNGVCVFFWQIKKPIMNP